MAVLFLIFLDQIRPKWIKLDQTWSNWISQQSKNVTIKSCHIYKKKTGNEWKPTSAPAEPKKEKKAPEKTEAPKVDGEKSDKQLKRDAKKAEKQVNLLPN